MKLYLQLVLLISQIDTNKEHDEFTYEIASSAMTIYQDEINDTESKFRSLYLILGTLNKTYSIGADNLDTLNTNATQYSSKLLKKSDQCVCVLRCTHLFFNEVLVFLQSPPYIPEIYLNSKMKETLQHVSKNV